MSPDVLARFLKKVVHSVNSAGCSRWVGAITGGGYGHLGVDGKFPKAHRLSYEHYVGPIPDGLDLDHLCRNRWCVNPDHLEPVSRRENLLRGDTIPAHEARRIHCPKGHPYDDKNTHIDTRGKRACRQCWREKALARYWAKKSKAA